mgnify:CR=1 FL=1
MKIYIAGHGGMVGSAMYEALKSTGDYDVITRSRSDLDLTDQASVASFFQSEKPDMVVIAAAKVGGIHANNTFPGQFIYENLQIQNNVIHQAHLVDVQKLIFLGSSCIYPNAAPQPMTENMLLTGTLEATNEAYAIAKIAGLKMCESYNRQYGRDYRCLMPSNLYGPGDNFNAENSHVIPALIHKFHKAKITNSNTVTIWGSGSPRREFLYVSDMVDAACFLMELDPEVYQSKVDPRCSHVNIGTGSDVTILELAELIKEIVQFKGQILFDQTKPDGSPRKLLNVDILRSLGWEHTTSLDKGLKKTYHWFCENLESLRDY